VVGFWILLTLFAVEMSVWGTCRLNGWSFWYEDQTTEHSLSISLMSSANSQIKKDRAEVPVR